MTNQGRMTKPERPMTTPYVFVIRASSFWFVIRVYPNLLRNPRAQQRELLLLLLALDHDCRLDQDEQNLLVLGDRAIGEQPLDEWDLGEHRDAGLALDFTREGL